MYRHAERDRLGLRDGLPHVLGEVRLRQEDERVGAAVPRGGEIALEPTRLEVAPAVGDEEDGVDIGGDHLLLGQPRLLARETRPARQDCANDAAVLARDGVEGDPVPRHRVSRGVQGAVRREQDHGAALLHRDAAGNEPFGLVSCEGVGEELAPAERLERMLQDETS